MNTHHAHFMRLSNSLQATFSVRKKKTPTNSLTQSILRYVNYNGFKCWRNNNGAIYSVKQKTFRKNPSSLLGISDIIGFRKSDGKFIAIEIKTGKDKLSAHQLIFISDIRSAGGIAIVAKSFEQFEDEFKKHL